jgi:hypothetical protein
MKGDHLIMRNDFLYGTETHLFTEILAMCFLDNLGPANHYIIGRFSAAESTNLSSKASPSQIAHSI